MIPPSGGPGGPLSGVPPASAAPPEGEPFDLPGEQRYSRGGLLGRGGMGEVRTALDRRLGRSVAFKTARGDDPSVARALVDEARLASRLDHPCILAVHDAGRDEQGRLYYTMPIVRGRTLAETLAEAGTLAERLRLVRHFVDLAEAVAYAHDQGVLHRDLKPGNVLVGAYGETVLVDWGLACTLSDAARPRAAVGSPGYSSPEQMAGAPCDARSDIYSLGATLYALVSGALPAQGGPPRPLDALCPEAPSELVAIVNKAMARDPLLRYPDAASLAADVGAWFEGRRVQAYGYTAWELLVRAVKANRNALLLLLASLLTIAGVGFVGWRRTSAERDKARSSEAEAVAARARSDADLAQALIAQSLVASAGGQRAQAEVLASQALTLGESAQARGVLARFGGRPRPEVVRRIPLPPCETVVISEDGVWVACVTPSETRIYRPDESPEPVAMHPVTGVSGVFAGSQLLLTDREHDGALVVGSDPPRWIGLEARKQPYLIGSPDPSRVLAYDRGALLLISVGEGHAERLAQPCPLPRHAQGFSLLGDGTFLYACSDGEVRRAALPGVTARPGAARMPADMPASLGVVTADPAGDRVLVAGTDGGMALLDLNKGTLVQEFLRGETVAGSVGASGDLVALAGYAGDVVLWRIGAPTPLTRIPSPSATVSAMHGGRRIRVVDDAITDWELPPSVRVHQIPTGSGIAAVALSPDGALVASGHGDGAVRVHRVADGALVFVGQVHNNVLKDVAFSPDGRALAVASAGDSAISLYSVPGFERTRLPLERPLLRVLFLDDEHLLGAPYEPDGYLAIPRVRRDNSLGAPTWMPVPLGYMVDLDGISGEGEAIAYGREGAVWSLSTRHEPTLLAEEEVLTVTAGAGRSALSLRSSTRIVEADGSRRTAPRTGSPPIDSALSPDGRWLALGHLDGETSVWRVEDLQQVARLHGHSAPVAAVAFDSSSAWLYTGSWDGDLRAWSMAEFDAPPAALAAELSASWALTQNEALSL